MRSEYAAKRVTVFVGETDRWDGRPLYQAIVTMLHAEGVAGVTVLRGVLGYGGSGKTHSAHILDVANDLPLAVVFVDSEQVVERVLEALDDMVETGLVTVEDVTAIGYAND